MPLVVPDQGAGAASRELLVGYDPWHPATYIKVIRKADTEAFDQYWVEIELKDK